MVLVSVRRLLKRRSATQTFPSIIHGLKPTAIIMGRSGSEALRFQQPRVASLRCYFSSAVKPACSK